MITSRMLSRRSVLLLVITGSFIGALLLVSRRLGDICPDGSYYCPDLSRFRPKPEHHSVPDKAQPTSQYADVLQTATEQAPAPHTTPVQPESHTQVTGRPARKPDPICENFPDASNILVIMKTGASEAYSKIPTQVLTNLRCVEDFLIFSDMEQEIAGVHIHDSLNTVLDEVKKGNNDFNLYFRQKQCPIDQDNCNKHQDVAKEGWSLDKYKNIHMAEKTFKLRPHHDWYLFVDADTYVVWPTMVEWLKQLDPTEPHYLGSVALLGGFPFGHGGSGYIVSHRAMQDFLEGKDGAGNRWDSEAAKTCCGDYMFAYAIKQEANIGVNNTWPTINGEKPHTLEYGDRQWCQPITTMHHIGSEEVSDFDAFEQERNFSSPMRIKDIYFRFVEPHLTDFRADWDNGSNDDLFLDPSSDRHDDWKKEKAKTTNLSPLEKKAHLSHEDCRRACSAQDNCYQYMWHDETCSFHHSVKHGKPEKQEDKLNSRYMSGWDVPKIKKWVAEHEKCGKIEWPNV